MMTLSLLVNFTVLKAGDISTESPSVQIIFTELRPVPPLDPFKPFSISFEIKNDKDLPITIPDLNRLQLEITNVKKSVVIRRDLMIPNSIKTIIQKAHAKAPPYQALKLNIDPHTSYRGQFLSLNAIPPLLAGPNEGMFSVTLENDTVIKSNKFLFSVMEEQPSFEQEILNGKAYLVNTQLRQKILLYKEQKKSRIVLLSKIYPDFMSVAADIDTRDNIEKISLIHYWPAQEIFFLFASIENKKVKIFQFVDKQPNISDEYILYDALAMRENQKFFGLIKIFLNEKGAGIDDYLLFTTLNNLDSRELIAEYWLRDWKKNCWRKAEVARYPIPSKSGEFHLSLFEEGFRVIFENDSLLCQLNISEKLPEYRRKALTDPMPIKNKVKRTN